MIHPNIGTNVWACFQYILVATNVHFHFSYRSNRRTAKLSSSGVCHKGRLGLVPHGPLGVPPLQAIAFAQMLTLCCGISTWERHGTKHIKSTLNYIYINIVGGPLPAYLCQVWGLCCNTESIKALTSECVCFSLTSTGFNVLSSCRPVFLSWFVAFAP